MKKKEKLYRKENTRTFGVFHKYGSAYSKERARNKNQEVLKTSMHGKKQRGVDYTPLFKFLLSKVGCNWDEVFSKAKCRLDKEDPIFWMVAMNAKDKKDYVRLGENTYYSGLYVDEEKILRIVNPNIANENFTADGIFTYSFNGKVIGKTAKNKNWTSDKFYKKTNG
jgi:hypothetical protein